MNAEAAWESDGERHAGVAKTTAVAFGTPPERSLNASITATAPAVWIDFGIQSCARVANAKKDTLTSHSHCKQKRPHACMAIFLPSAQANVGCT